MQVKSRKNFFPAFLVACFSWLALFVIIFRFSPYGYVILALFYLFLFLALFLTTSLIFANSKRGFLIAAFISLSLYFAYQHLANPLYLIILASIFILLEFILKKED